MELLDFEAFSEKFGRLKKKKRRESDDDDDHCFLFIYFSFFNYFPFKNFNVKLVCLRFYFFLSI